ncbi:MAG TPA: nucleotidyltransferase [Mariniphaga anaerophila]|uniref:Nucleotidyltransferase n=1 Tax=Mariniphaga anaerophila TaxID=1484053 RepID=A0A831LRH2_9BACT|nr:nucleotidyltransferase [Mariniphaga anaerophila]
MNLVEKNIEKINELCLEYKVSELYVFGSVLTGRFNKESDIDLLVDFDDMDLFNYADNYFDFKFALENILNRKVDLLEKKAIKNPYLKKSIDSSKKLIYGQRDKNLVV